MITWSGFVRYWAESAGRLPRRVREDIRQRAADLPRASLPVARAGSRDAASDERRVSDREGRRYVVRDAWHGAYVSEHDSEREAERAIERETLPAWLVDAARARA